MDFPLWGCDTGGLLSPWAKSRTVPPDKELMARWMAFSAYTPVMETLIGPERTPWADYDQEMIDLTRRFAWLHHDLIPYTRSFLAQSATDGRGVIRPLIYAFPDDASLGNRWDEYMYGSEILVAPVLNSLHGWGGRSLEFSPGYVPHLSVETTEREVYLPRGTWLDYNDRRTVLQGPCTLHLRPDLKTIPTYVREGAIVPRGDVLRGNNNWTTNWSPTLRIELFPGSKSGTPFTYHVGEEGGPGPGRSASISCERVGDGLTVRSGDLGASGTLELYCRQMAGITRQGVRLRPGQDYRFDAAAHVLRVPFRRSLDLAVSGVSSLFPDRSDRQAKAVHQSP